MLVFPADECCLPFPLPLSHGISALREGRKSSCFFLSVPRAAGACSDPWGHTYHLHSLLTQNGLQLGMCYFAPGREPRLTPTPSSGCLFLSLTTPSTLAHRGSRLDPPQTFPRPAEAATAAEDGIIAEALAAPTICPKVEEGLWLSSAGLPCSTSEPSESTSSWSQSMMVSMRWAMTSSTRPLLGSLQPGWGGQVGVGGVQGGWGDESGKVKARKQARVEEARKGKDRRDSLLPPLAARSFFACKQAHLCAKSLRACWMRASVARSTFAVASSRAST
jgi:hypothetical protein